MITIVKIGGNIINNSEKLDSFLSDFSKLNDKKILVHGGGREATELSNKLGRETKMINGRRITDLDTLEIVTMVYAGLINKRIVSKLQDFDCNAIGLTGADGHIIPAKRRPPIPVDFGYVGDIDPSDINLKLVSLLLNNHLSPVFCAICHESKGHLLNCNADSVASALAVACASLDSVRLIYCFEKMGVLSDPDDNMSYIPLITQNSFTSLVENKVISGGMIPKVTNALNAIKQGVDEVRICDASNLLNNIGTSVKA